MEQLVGNSIRARGTAPPTQKVTCNEIRINRGSSGQLDTPFAEVVVEQALTVARGCGSRAPNGGTIPPENTFNECRVRLENPLLVTDSLQAISRMQTPPTEAMCRRRPRT